MVDYCFQFCGHFSNVVGRHRCKLLHKPFGILAVIQNIPVRFENQAGFPTNLNLELFGLFFDCRHGVNFCNLFFKSLCFLSILDFFTNSCCTLGAGLCSFFIRSHLRLCLDQHLTAFENLLKGFYQILDLFSSSIFFHIRCNGRFD